MVTALEENNLIATYYVPETHHPMIAKWWEGHGWEVIPAHALPQIGIIVSDGKNDICAGFLYRTDSTICWPEFIVSNPAFKDKRVRNNALDLLIDQLTHVGKELGFRSAFSSINNPSLANRFVKSGYTIHEHQMINVLKEL